MPVKTCPECGAGYVASVQSCSDCGVPLVADEEPAAGAQAGEGAEGGAEPGEGQIVYSFEEWGNGARVMLDGLLTTAGVTHVWEAGALVVAAGDEDTVDELVDQVDDALLRARPGLDGDREQVDYDLTDWEQPVLDRLGELLAEAEIDYEVDLHARVVSVYAQDEDRVDGLVEDVIAEAGAGRIEGDGDDGLAAQDALSDLFVAADRLLHDTEDSEAVLGLVDAVAAAEALPLPFGFDRDDWDGIVGRAVTLRDLLDDEHAEEADVRAAARDLRSAVRPLV